MIEVMFAVTHLSGTFSLAAMVLMLWKTGLSSRVVLNILSLMPLALHPHHEFRPSFDSTT
jgi:hypothetical protein